MANITITIPDNLVTRVSTALGYQTQVPGPNGTTINNTQTRAQYCKQYIIDRVKQAVAKYEAEEAEKQHTLTVQTANDKALNEITLS